MTIMTIPIETDNLPKNKWLKFSALIFVKDGGETALIDQMTVVPFDGEVSPNDR